MVRVFDQAIAGELVGLLAVLAPALAVALAGQAAVPAGRLADLAQRQHQVGEGQDRVDALRLLLGPAARQEHAAPGVGQQPDGRAQLADRDAGQPLDARRVVLQGGPADLVEARGPGRDVRLVDQALLDRQVEQAVGQGQVGAGRELQVQIGGAGGVGPARVDDDERAAARRAGGRTTA